MTIEAHPLTLYLASAGESASSFAARAGIAPDLLGAILAGNMTPDLALARRLSAAAGGGVTVSEMLPNDAPVVDAFARKSPAGQPLNAPLLSAVIEVVAPEAFAPQSSEAYRAAEVAADIYAALCAITSISRADRLAEALRPALRESFAKRADRRDPDGAAERAARLYFAAEARLSA